MKHNIVSGKAKKHPKSPHSVTPLPPTKPTPVKVLPEQFGQELLQSVKKD